MKKNSLVGKLKVILVISLMLMPFLVVYSQAILSKVNLELEKKKHELNMQKKKNESLSMKIDELASLSKMKVVAAQKGLSYNNNNIIRVAKQN